MTVSIPVSVGELVDKITILQIKQSMITDEKKLEYINEECDRLCKILDEYKSEHDIQIPTLLIEKLYSINLSMWHIEDNVRIKERDQDFGPEFIELARSVYFTNDQRSRIKQKINKILGSKIKEVKQYTKY